MLRNPMSYVATCPHCGQEACIFVKDAVRFWLADAGWWCPWCEYFSTTAEIQDATDARKAGPVHEGRDRP
jgi:sarcosine oxidase delta subunit